MPDSPITLVVLENSQERKAVERALRRLGISYESRQDIVRSETTELQHVSVLITDWLPSEGDRPSLVRFARSLRSFSSLPILAIFDRTANPAPHHIFADGATDALAFPLDDEGLQARIAAVVQLRRRATCWPLQTLVHEAHFAVTEALQSSLPDQSKLLFATARLLDITEARHCSVVFANKDSSFRATAVAGQSWEALGPLVEQDFFRNALEKLTPAVVTTTEQPAAALTSAAVFPFGRAGKAFGAIVLGDSKNLAARRPSEHVLATVNTFTAYLAASVTSYSFATGPRAISTEYTGSSTQSVAEPLSLLQCAANASVNALVSIDAAGSIRIFNRSAEKLLGFTAEDMVGNEELTKILNAQDATKVLSLLNDGASPVPSLRVLRTHIKTAAGRWIPVRLSTSVYGDGDQVGGVVISLTQIESQVTIPAKLTKGQQRLEEKKRKSLVVQLAGAAAHELNQPLTVIMGYAEMLKRMGRLKPDHLAWLEVIIGESERMAQIVRKIGRITNFKTKDYLGNTTILDLDSATKSSPPDPPPDSTSQFADNGGFIDRDRPSTPSDIPDSR